MWKRICAVLCCLFISVLLDIQLSEGFGILLTCLTPPHCCVYSNPESGFLTSYVMVFFMFNDCSFCWYRTNYCPSLFHLSFHYISIVDIMIICFLFLSFVDIMIICFLFLSFVDIMIICFLYLSFVDIMIICFLFLSFVMFGIPTYHDR
jgi:hypothetical protein